MNVAKCVADFDVLGKEMEKLTMKTVVSFVLGAVMLFGAATLGLPSGSASAKDKHDRNYRHHHHRHHRHHKHRTNHLSY